VTVAVEQHPEVGRSDPLVGVESEAIDQVEGPLAGRLDVARRYLALDLHELPEAGNVVEGDRVPVDRVPLAGLLDGRDRVEPEVFEDRSQSVAVGDPGFDLLTGLRHLVDEGPLVGDPAVGFLPGAALAPDPEGLVGLAELPVWGVVVRVGLDHLAGAVGVQSLKP